MANGSFAGVHRHTLWWDPRDSAHHKRSLGGYQVMAMSELHQRIQAALLCIKLNGPKDHYLGICANVVAILGDEAEMDDAVDDVLTGLFEDWPDKSTSIAYPVGNWSQTPSKLFWWHHDHLRPMWNRKDRYGQARWALLEHALSKLGGSNG